MNAYGNFMVKEMHWFRLALLSFWLVVGLLACTAVATPTPCQEACVSPEFQAFYEEYGGARTFGQPHKETFVDPLTGRRVQYFDGARLELDSDTGQIYVASLGEWAFAGLDEPRLANVPNSSPQRFFPSTGYWVQDAFLLFYESYHGEVVLGQPISPQLDEGELRVQYFEQGRLEWHPEAPVARQVQMGQLGRAHYLIAVRGSLGGEVILAQPESRATAAEVTAAVRSPILYEEDEQLLYVVAVDANSGQPIIGAEVQVRIRYNGEVYEQMLSTRTNNQGTVQAVLDLPTMVPGQQILVDVLVIYPGDTQPVGQANISFQTWY